MTKIKLAICLMLFLCSCTYPSENVISLPSMADNNVNSNTLLPESSNAEAKILEVPIIPPAENEHSDSSLIELTFANIENEVSLAVNMNYNGFKSIEGDLYDFASEGTHIIGIFDGNKNLVKLEACSYGSIGKSESIYYFIEEMIYIIETVFNYAESIYIENEPTIIEKIITEYAIVDKTMYMIEREKELLVPSNEKYEITIRFIDSCKTELSK